MYLSFFERFYLQIIIYSNLKVKIIAWSKVLLLVIQPKYFQAILYTNEYRI